ncbi:MAG: G5 domain-containing protein [Phascolarctobacterium sp.]|nr:G5 domain-containing protein [Phascolarctobacterium sp.]MBQ7760138.1 G5 domain-containing protein [Acidaminococcaceae bacterium]
MSNKRLRRCLGILLCAMLTVPFLVGFDLAKKIIVVNDETTYVEQNIEMPVEYIYDDTIAKGVDTVEVEGRSGRERVIYKTVTKADGSVKAEVVKREIIKKPVAQVVRMGAAPSVKTKDGYRRFKQKLVVQATAYWTHDPVDASGTGIAYDGTPAVPYKTIAVDPKVIPLQSQVYIPGIGQVRANDTGSAIKGKIIDIAMDSRKAAWNWGRRNIEIYILEE